MTTWQDKNMTTWHNDNMSTWQHDNMKIWEHDNMTLWQHVNRNNAVEKNNISMDRTATARETMLVKK